MIDYSIYSDQELGLMTCEGDADAFKEIYMRYNELLYIFAYRKLKDEVDAKDTVHDVFAWLWEKRTQLVLKTSLSSYLYKSVLNRIFDIFRKRDVFKRYVEVGNHFIDVDTQKADYLIREKDIVALVEKEIASMPPRMREVYQLKYKEHISADQISQRLGITRQTVITHIKHANKRLRDKLGLFVFILWILNQ